MFEFKRLRSLLVLAVTAGSLTACSAGAPSSPRIEAPQGMPPVLSLPGQAHLEISQAPQTETSDLLAQLKLSDAQRKALEAIGQGAPQDTRSAALQRLLLAPQIDAEAIKSQYALSEEEVSRAVSDLEKVRDILTPEQRQKLVQALSQQGAGASQASSESQLKTMREQLKLTPDQERAYTAMTTALQSHAQAERKRMQDAYAAIMSGGDSSAFRQALLEANRTLPIDAMIAFYRSLSQSQRQTLFGTSQNNASR